MSKVILPEVWLRGPSNEYPVLLQPVAHALLQAREEVIALMDGFDDELLWDSVSGMASPGFHLQHLAGVADRLFTYARGEALTEGQLKFLKQEKMPPYQECSSHELVSGFSARIDLCLEQLKSTKEDSLGDLRAVGRSKLPSTVLGLLVHTAEHTMRHVGQLLVTVKVLSAQKPAKGKTD